MVNYSFSWCHESPSVVENLTSAITPKFYSVVLFLVIFSGGYQLPSLRLLLIRKWGWRGFCFSKHLFQLAKRCATIQVFSLQLPICKLFKSGRGGGFKEIVKLERPCYSLNQLVVYKNSGSFCNAVASMPYPQWPGHASWGLTFSTTHRPPSNPIAWKHKYWSGSWEGLSPTEGRSSGEPFS